MEVAQGAVFWNSAHDFVRLVRSGGDLAPIEVDGQGFITLIGELRSLLLNPVVQSPPFMDDDQGWKRTVAGRGVENGLDSLLAAFVGDRLAVGSEGGERED